MKPFESDRISHEEIARRAFALYQARGRTAGQELNDWLAAEQELRSSGIRSSFAAPAVASTPQNGRDNHSNNTPAHQQARDNPFARDERGTPNREEIRTRTPHPAARQSMRRGSK